MDEKIFGLIGRKLGHSYSPQIHAFLGDYSYELFELESDELEAFFRGDGFDGVNVTIPYKETVIPYLDEISEKIDENDRRCVLLKADMVERYV